MARKIWAVEAVHNTTKAELTMAVCETRKAARLMRMHFDGKDFVANFRLRVVSRDVYTDEDAQRIYSSQAAVEAGLMASEIEPPVEDKWTRADEEASLAQADYYEGKIKGDV